MVRLKIWQGSNHPCVVWDDRKHSLFHPCIFGGLSTPTVIYINNPSKRYRKVCSINEILPKISQAARFYCTDKLK